MNALVIGGNRYVGRRLVNLLRERGVYVSVLNRSGTGDANAFIKADRNNLAFLKKEFAHKSWDIVYDFACIHPQDTANSVELFTDKVKQYIVISSQSVYENGRDISEEEFNPKNYVNFNPNDKSLSYKESKRQMEVGFFKYAKFPVVAVRFPIILGLDDYTERLKFHLDKIKEEQEIYFPNISAKISFVSSEEASQFLDFMLKKDFSGTINFCSEDSISIYDLLVMIESSLNKKAILSTEASDKNQSPFGIESDWFMSVKKCKDLGYRPSKLHDWLPNLVKEMSSI